MIVLLISLASAKIRWRSAQTSRRPAEETRAG
jgi:hypothetical protein